MPRVVKLFPQPAIDDMVEANFGSEAVGSVEIKETPLVDAETASRLASMLGKLGGSAKSAAKTLACRKNAKARWKKHRKQKP